MLQTLQLLSPNISVLVEAGLKSADDADCCREEIPPIALGNLLIAVSCSVVVGFIVSSIISKVLSCDTCRITICRWLGSRSFRIRAESNSGMSCGFVFLVTMC